MNKQAKIWLGAAFGLGIFAVAVQLGGVFDPVAPDQISREISSDHAQPQNIVSINLCTDQLLIALADVHQIGAITRFAVDPNMSAAADRARAFPLLSSSGEDLVHIAPEILIGMPATGSPQANLLRGSAMSIIDLPFIASYDDIISNLRLLGGAIGQNQRAEALIQKMDRRLQAVKPNGHGRVAAYYQRRGFMTGTGTLVDDMMRRVGLRNLASVQGKPTLSQMSLEEMLAAQPDFLIVEAESLSPTDQGTEMLQHPALEHIPRLAIPEALTVCGGPEYPQAVERLSAQIAAFDRLSIHSNSP